MKTKTVDIYAMICTKQQADLSICGGVLIPYESWEGIAWECQECGQRSNWYQTVYATVEVNAETGEQQ